MSIYYCVYLYTNSKSVAEIKTRPPLNIKNPSSKALTEIVRMNDRKNEMLPGNEAENSCLK